MGSIAYALREEFEGTVEVFDTQEDFDAGNGREVPKFAGGTFAIGEGETFDVAAELEEGEGVIVVDDRDQVLVMALDEYPALKRVAVPEGREPLREYDGQSVGTLRAECRRRGLAVGGTKPQLIERLEANDAAVAAGDQEGAQDPTPEIENEGGH